MAEPPVDEPLFIEPDDEPRVVDDPLFIDGLLDGDPLFIVDPVEDDPLELDEPLFIESVDEPLLVEPLFGEPLFEEPVAGDVPPVAPPVSLPDVPGVLPPAELGSDGVGDVLLPVDGDVAPLLDEPEVLPGVRPVLESCDCEPGVCELLLPGPLPVPEPLAPEPVPLACAYARPPIVKPTTAASAVLRNCFMVSLLQLFASKPAWQTKWLEEGRQAPCPWNYIR